MQAQPGAKRLLVEIEILDARGDVPDQNVYIGKVSAGAVEVASRATDVAQGR